MTPSSTSCEARAKPTLSLSASTVFDGVLHATVADLLCNLPADAIAGKPLSLVTTGGLGNQFVAVERQLRSILEWWEPITLPGSLPLHTPDRNSKMLSERARWQLREAHSVISASRYH